MGWLRFVGSFKLQVSFTKEPYKRDNIVQKRPTLHDLTPVERTLWSGIVWHIWHVGIPMDTNVSDVWHDWVIWMSHSYEWVIGIPTCQMCDMTEWYEWVIGLPTNDSYEWLTQSCHTSVTCHTDLSPIWMSPWYTNQWLTVGTPMTDRWYTNNWPTNGHQCHVPPPY